MFKCSILYPNQKDIRFDLMYYLERHMVMAKELTKNGCLGTEVEVGANKNEDAPFMVITHFYFRSQLDFETYLAPNIKSFATDVPFFCNVEPIVQLSEVVMDELPVK